MCQPPSGFHLPVETFPFCLHLQFIKKWLDLHAIPPQVECPSSRPALKSLLSGTWDSIHDLHLFHFLPHFVFYLHLRHLGIMMDSQFPDNGNGKKNEYPHHKPGSHDFNQRKSPDVPIMATTHRRPSPLLANRKLPE